MPSRVVAEFGDMVARLLEGTEAAALTAEGMFGGQIVAPSGPVVGDGKPADVSVLTDDCPAMCTAWLPWIRVTEGAAVGECRVDFGGCAVFAHRGTLLMDVD